MKPSTREPALLGAIAVLLALPAFGVPGFYTAANLRALALDNLPVLVAALGMTAVIVAAQIDVAAGSQFVVIGALAGVAARAGWPMPVVVAAAVAAGALLGAANGLLVVRLRIPAIVATLGTMVILRHGVVRATGGDWIRDLPPGFQWFGLPQATAQPLYMAAAAALTVLVALALRFTAAGRALYAVGCDPEAARRVGLRPERVVLGAFVLAGVCVATAALLNCTRYPTIETNAGLGFELKVIAAVVVGGTAVTGGRGSIAGTVLGVMLLGTIGTVFTFLHVNPAWEKAIQGAIILVAVVGDTAWRKERARA